MLATIARMGRQKNATNHEKYRKPARSVRIREPLAARGELLAARLAMDLTELANTALREKLEREGFWPDMPPSEKAKGG